MANLLTEHYKRNNKTEYRLRVIGTTLAMFAVLIAVAGVLLVPSYFLASHRRAVAQNDPLLQDDKEGALSREKQREVEGVIRETNSVLGVLGAMNGQFNASQDVVAKIVGFKTAPITITGIFYDAAVTGGTLAIKGTATSRQGLISFADTLKKDPSFASVDLPISNLVKDRDISFSITIKLKGATSEEAATRQNIAPATEEPIE